MLVAFTAQAANSHGQIDTLSQTCAPTMCRTPMVPHSPDPVVSIPLGFWPPVCVPKPVQMCNSCNCLDSDRRVVKERCDFSFKLGSPRVCYLFFRPRIAPDYSRSIPTKSVKPPSTPQQPSKRTFQLPSVIPNNNPYTNPATLHQLSHHHSH